MDKYSSKVISSDGFNKLEIKLNEQLKTISDAGGTLVGFQQSQNNDRITITIIYKIP